MVAIDPIATIKHAAILRRLSRCSPDPWRSSRLSSLPPGSAFQSSYFSSKVVSIFVSFQSTVQSIVFVVIAPEKRGCEGDAGGRRPDETERTPMLRRPELD